MTSTGYRLCRNQLLDAARRRRHPTQSLRDAIGHHDAVALVSMRLTQPTLRGRLTEVVFSRLGAGPITKETYQ